MAEQLREFLIENNVITLRQYGFRQFSNTTTALFDITTFIQNARDRGLACVAVFIDLKKAFDAVYRCRLLKKLQNIGIIGTSHNWFKSYLSSRLQYVELEYTKSSLESIDEGVPQGTRLAPDLFNIYINDIEKIELSGTLFLYADDIVITYSNSNIEQIEGHINSDLIKLNKWMETNKLTVNTDKTKYMVFNRTNDTKLNIFYMGKPLQQVNNFKYLGVTLDKHLSWESQIKKIVSGLSSICGLFRKISSYVPMSSKLSISTLCFNLKYFMEYLFGVRLTNQN